MSLPVTAIDPVMLTDEMMLLPGNRRFHLNSLNFSYLIKKNNNLMTGSWEQPSVQKLRKFACIIKKISLILLVGEVRGGWLLSHLRLMMLMRLLIFCEGILAYLIYMSVDTESIGSVWVNVKVYEQVTLLVSTCGKRDPLMQRDEHQRWGSAAASHRS